jgi:hypothetical protein
VFSDLHDTATKAQIELDNILLLRREETIEIRHLIDILYLGIPLKENRQIMEALLTPVVMIADRILREANHEAKIGDVIDYLEKLVTDLMRVAQDPLAVRCMEMETIENLKQACHDLSFYSPRKSWWGWR